VLSKTILKQLGDKLKRLQHESGYKITESAIVVERN
jgi:hypothetical protein